ncbi:MAG: hypothetical protein ACLR0U_06830 [Enterocloster clostridioformis]
MWLGWTGSCTPCQRRTEKWLDNQLVDKFCISEMECRELYMNGFRDAMRLIMVVGL